MNKMLETIDKLIKNEEKIMQGLFQIKDYYQRHVRKAKVEDTKNLLSICVRNLIYLDDLKDLVKKEMKDE